jgi:hypothetical protein
MLSVFFFKVVCWLEMFRNLKQKRRNCVVGPLMCLCVTSNDRTMEIIQEYYSHSYEEANNHRLTNTKTLTDS